jgi:transposase
MPLPVSPHQPAFTAAQLLEARTVAAQHSAPHAQVLRARLTLVLADEPTISHREAAVRSGLRYPTLYKWRRRWTEQGWSLEDAPRPGRKPVFSP